MGYTPGRRGHTEGRGTVDFVDRRMELGVLDDLWSRPGAQLLVVYGRRRVGKTRLLTHWADTLAARGLAPASVGGDGEACLYWMATQTSTVNQLRSFSQALLGFVQPGARVEATFSYASWAAAIEAAAHAARDGRRLVILDEFTYVMQANPEVPSLLQGAWDHTVKDRSNLFLVLTGSLAGMIQRHVLDYQAPLYGRATGRIRLGPLPFGALGRMLPRYSPEERVAVYAVTGGIPAYVELFDDKMSVADNLRRRIVSPSNLMLRDAVFLVGEQLDQPRNYIAVLEAIGAGYHGLTDVATRAGIERSNVGKYLGVLQELGYVERQVPATVRRPEQSRRGRYVLSDAYLRFYYRFLAPYLGLIERGMIEPTVALLRDHLIDFIGTHTFEELCREWVAVQAETHALPFVPERIGSFWSPDAQVDVVAINARTKDLLLAECKWGTAAVGRSVLRDLVAKTDAVRPDGPWRVHYACFARKGFTDAARAEASAAGIHLVTLDDLAADLAAWANPPAPGSSVPW
jgi:uncharacterized protein